MHQNFRPDKAFCRLVWQSLQHTVYFKGNYQTVQQGLSRSHPMSPLLGAIALLPLDRAMQKLPVFYRRYMDDWVIIAPSRWKLKRAIKTMHQVLATLKLCLHPDKTSIGRTDKGFDFLGYHLKPGSLSPSSLSLQHFREHRLRLYEQHASNERMRAYVFRWCAYFRGGGDIFEKIRLPLELTPNSLPDFFSINLVGLEKNK